MYAEVIVDISNEAVDRPYTYRVPEGLSLAPGDRVQIPFGRGKKARTGCVLSLRETADFDTEKVKDILGKVENAVSAKEQLLRLAVWMSQEYGTTLNQCLKTVLPVKKTVRKNARRIDPLLRYAGQEDFRPVLNAEQAAARDQLLSAFRECFGASKAMPEAAIPEAASRAIPAPEHTFPPRFLLHGITGSGKTEVYLQIMEEVVAAGWQVIFLIPEISLTFQTVLRISSRFQGKTAILHSRMSAGERYEQYLRCERGEVDILVGPRSALFAPFSRLGLIIMDEEHEGAYKSETSPRYETRDAAYMRARLAACPLLYGSATPSLRIYTEALEGRVRLLQLRERAGQGSSLPDTEIVDLREELANGNRSIFSARLRELVEDRLSKKEQIMLFINRRGYASFLSCRSCGQAVKCPHCDVTLTLHIDGMLRCHYCDFSRPLMKECPDCGSKYLAPFGVGTEKLETITKEAFPSARVLRMDADTTARKGGHDAIIERFRNRGADILIGTQMIVKGHDFPDVTLVGILAADLSLFVPDFMAQERTFQLITQAAGRAGRGGAAGRVIIQSYQPCHYAIVLAKRQDYALFYEKEMDFRRMLSYPPVEFMMAIELSSGDENLLYAVAERAVRAFRAEAAQQGAELIGPLRAGLYKLKDIYRKIVYIKHPDHAAILRLRDAFSQIVRQQDSLGLIRMGYDLL